MMYKLLPFFLGCFISLSTMEIDRVILSTDDNPDYIQFWPIVAKAWKKMGIKPTLALIGDSHTQIDETLGEVIRFSPIAGVPTALQAQVIRLLLPVYYPDECCLISDIDILPLRRTYFVDSIKHVPEDAFVVYRDRAFDSNTPQFPMCYVVAKGGAFMSLFQIKTSEEIPLIIQKWHQLNWGWTTDQRVLYDSLIRWDHFQKRCVKLGHKVKRRIDRGKWEKYKEISSLRRGYYIDAHLPRPYDQYKTSIDPLLGLQE